MMEDLPAVVRRNDQVLSSDLNGEIVLLKPETGDCYSLQGAGAVIWQAAAQPATVEDLAAALRDRYDVSPEQALADVRHFLTDLVGEGLIVRESVA